MASTGLLDENSTVGHEAKVTDVKNMSDIPGHVRGVGSVMAWATGRNTQTTGRQLVKESVKSPQQVF